MRFASAQILACVENGLWLRLARQANAAAGAIAAGLGTIEGVGLIAPVQANELFVAMAPAAVAGLAEEGILFQRRGPGLARFVCRWDTSEDEVKALVAAVRRQVHLLQAQGRSTMDATEARR
jgi:threonine aldolase